MVSSRTTRRAIVTGALAGATGIADTGRTAGAAEPDPIYALIATHQAAIDEIERQARGAHNLDPTKEAYEAESAAVTALLRATPTTPAGAIAMLRHFHGSFAADYGSPPFSDYPGMRADADKTLFGRLAGVLAGRAEA
jgi:hypothetical protein